MEDLTSLARQDHRSQRRGQGDPGRKYSSTTSHDLKIQIEQATWDDKKGAEGKPQKRALKMEDIQALHPFHWAFAFDK